MSLKGGSCWDVNIRMNHAEKLSLEAIGRFVEASEEVQFEAEDRQQLCGWGERVLVEQEYAQQGKAARGLLRRYVGRMTGRSRAQVTRPRRSLHGHRPRPADGLPAAAFCRALHACRHRAAGPR